MRAEEAFLCLATMHDWRCFVSCAQALSLNLQSYTLAPRRGRIPSPERINALTSGKLSQDSRVLRARQTKNSWTIACVAMLVQTEHSM